MQLSVQKRNQYIALSVAVVAFAVLTFIWMCLGAEAYPSPAVWILCAFAFYIPVACMASVFHFLVTDIRSASTRTVNLFHLAYRLLSRYSVVFRRDILLVPPLSGLSLLYTSLLGHLALCSRWHPSTYPQLK